MATLSTVTPVYAGQDHLEDLVREIATFRESGGLDGIEHLESIFVLDAAIDNSASVLRSIEERISWVRVIELGRNFGQHSATACGLAEAQGDWVVTMDEDLQHRPEAIADLFAAAQRENLLLVYGTPKGKQIGAFRDFSAKLAKWIVAATTKEKNVRVFGSFRLIKGELARVVGKKFSVDMYLDILFSWYTNRIGSVVMDLVDERGNQGKSGYRLTTLLRHFRRMVMSSDLRVIRMFSGIGLLSVVGSFLFFLVILLLRLLHPDSITVEGWVSTIAAIFLFGGIIIIQISVALEVICAILNKVRGKPAFFSLSEEESDQD